MQKNTLTDNSFDFIGIARALLEKKIFIFSTTLLLTLTSVIYVSNASPKYKVTAYISSPSDILINNFNRDYKLDETKDTVLKLFLDEISSPKFREDVLMNSSFLSTVKEQITPSTIENYKKSFLASIEISPPKTKISKFELVGDMLESSYMVSMQGSNPIIISNYINILLSEGDKSVANHFYRKKQNNLSDNLLTLSQKRLNLINRAKKLRLNQIKQIKEQDLENIREINTQIDSLRLIAKQNRLNQIMKIKEQDIENIRAINESIFRSESVAENEKIKQIAKLSESAKLAGFLGITENNLETINDSKDESLNLSLNIAFNEENNFPDWYKYGEKALLLRVKLLQEREALYSSESFSLMNELKATQNNVILKTLVERKNDDHFIPELPFLMGEINEFENNNTLKTLVDRVDEIYISELIDIDSDKTLIELSLLNLKDISLINIPLKKIFKTNNLSKNKSLTVVLTFIFSLISSFLLVLFLNEFKLKNRTLSKK